MRELKPRDSSDSRELSPQSRELCPVENRQDLWAAGARVKSPPAATRTRSHGVVDAGGQAGRELSPHPTKGADVEAPPPLPWPIRNPPWFSRRHPRCGSAPARPLAGRQTAPSCAWTMARIGGKARCPAGQGADRRPGWRLMCHVRGLHRRTLDAQPADDLGGPGADLFLPQVQCRAGRLRPVWGDCARHPRTAFAAT